MKLIVLSLAVLVTTTPLLAQPTAEDLDKQLQTVVTLYELGSVWFGWLAENALTDFPGRDPGPIPDAPEERYDSQERILFDLRRTGRPITHAEFLELISPYVENLLEGDPEEIPTHDAWGRPLEFRFRWDMLASQVMSIRSPGRDGVFSEPIYPIGPYPPEQVDDDIVWGDGFFLSYPDGIPKKAMDGAANDG